LLGVCFFATILFLLLPAGNEYQAVHWFTAVALSQYVAVLLLVLLGAHAGETLLQFLWRNESLGDEQL
jgi:succinate dehydrogenase hydrophobic anchor subunit